MSATETHLAKPRAAPDKGVGWWLIAVCVLLIAMILIGGATRLTGSGLSITEWKPVTGAIPPLSDAHWAAEFEKYRQTTQFRQVNPDIHIDDFKVLYFWEWGHRFLGRISGLVFAAGFFFFGWRGRLKGRFWACAALLGMGAAQGAVGWWMVTTGLDARIAVAPQALATHLGLAFIILALAWRLALEAFDWPSRAGELGVRYLDWIFAAALFVQIILGAFMAGSGAGLAYSDWPLIGGEVIPSTYGALTPFVENFFSNHAAVQFNHRTAGYLVWGLAAAIAAVAWSKAQGAAKPTAYVLFAIACVQVLLGIGAIVMGAPLSMNLIHQGGAVALWLAAHSLIGAKSVR